MTIDPDDAWTAVLARDRAFDGRFVTGVLTTGSSAAMYSPTSLPLRRTVMRSARE